MINIWLYNSFTSSYKLVGQIDMDLIQTVKATDKSLAAIRLETSEKQRLKIQVTSHNPIIRYLRSCFKLANKSFPPFNYYLLSDHPDPPETMDKATMHDEKIL